jgi:hypothetical protein
VPPCGGNGKGELSPKPPSVAVRSWPRLLLEQLLTLMLAQLSCPAATLVGDLCIRLLLLLVPPLLLLELLLMLPGGLLLGLLPAMSSARGMLPLCALALSLLLGARAPRAPAAAAAQPAGPAWHCQRRPLHMLQGSSSG